MLLLFCRIFSIILVLTSIYSVVIDEEYDDNPLPLIEQPEDEYFINSTHTRLGKLGSNVICLVNRSTLEDTKSSFSLKDHLNGSMCTHLLFAHANLCEADNICGLEKQPDNKTDFGGLSELRHEWPNLRIGVSIGGWEEGSQRFSKVTTDLWSRFRFAANVVGKLKEHNMTAVELSWFAPTIRYGGKPQDRENYVELMKEFSKVAKKMDLHVGVAIRIIDGEVDPYYDIASLSPFVDWFRLEGHSLHTHFEEFSGFNAPLYSRKGDTKTVAYWVQHVAAKSDPRRLLLDLPFYGRFWLLDEEPVPGGPGSPSSGFSFRKPQLQYNKVCRMLQDSANPPWQLEWDPLSMTPWAIRDTSYISYDDQRSLKAKVEFADRNHLAGVAIHTVDMDDFEGNCGKGNLPLLSAVKEAVDSTKRNLNKKTSVKSSGTKN